MSEPGGIFDQMRNQPDELPLVVGTGPGAITMSAEGVLARCAATRDYYGPVLTYTRRCLAIDGHPGEHVFEEP